jgi:DNA-binding NarL/FixJ family response regulator
MASIRVLLVDNEEVFRKGLARLIDEQPNMEVVHQCADWQEAVAKAGETKPDVVLIDSQTPHGDIASRITEISNSFPQARVALFARVGAETTAVDAVKAGVRAYLAKNISAADLVKSIELISTGRVIISPAFADKFLTEIARAGDQKTETQGQPVLSRRELDVVQLVARGASNKEIAQELFIAENTVKVHVRNILNKLDLRNRQQLVAYAVLQNWVTIEGRRSGEGGGTQKPNPS